MMDRQVTPAIEFNDVWKSYSGDGAFVLRGVSLRVARGSFAVLAGTSGSGKTTLLKTVNRLIEPTRGMVRVDGADVMTMDAVRLRRQIGYVFQGVGLFPHMTVAENIAITPKLLNRDKAEIAARVDELLDLVKLPRALKPRLPATLSGGQAQRVGIARALAARPRIVLMDEPFGAVDPLTRDALAGDYRALHDALGLTTVMVSHDVTEAVLLADRIAVLHHGELIEQGSAGELLTRPKTDWVRRLMQLPVAQAGRVAMLAGRA